MATITRTWTGSRYSYTAIGNAGTLAEATLTEAESFVRGESVSFGWGRPFRTSCCREAELVPCVCLQHTRCRIHGARHIGTHD